MSWKSMLVIRFFFILLCMTVGTKEAAFTYAISSAGVVYSIARSCVEGNLSACGCSRERRPKDLKSEFQWGGCGDNIEEGVRFTKQFMIAGEDNKAKETRKQERTLMNLHNNEVGIQVRDSRIWFYLSGTSILHCSLMLEYIKR